MAQGRRSGEVSPATKVGRLEQYNVEGELVAQLVEKYGEDWPKVAHLAGMSIMKARRLYTRHTLNPRLRVVGSPERVAAEIARLRDEEDVPWFPDLWARTGLGDERMKALYEQASGRPWKESGPRGSYRRQPPEERRAGAPRRSTKTVPQIAAARRDARKKEHEERLARARHNRHTRVHPPVEPPGPSWVEQVWNNDTPIKRVVEILTGRSIVVGYGTDGRETKPVVYAVEEVRRVAPGKTGRVIDFLDGEGRTHVVANSAITAVS